MKTHGVSSVGERSAHSGETAGQGGRERRKPGANPPPRPPSDDLLGLIQRCLDRGYCVEVVRCGQYADPGKPYLCAVRRGGFGTDNHLVYGNDAAAIMREAMEAVLGGGFTQPQDRYGLGRKSDAERGVLKGSTEEGR